MNALTHQYHGKDLGLDGKYVYVDPALKQYKLPMSQRDATDNSVGRGTRFDMDKDKEYMRGFIHWTDMKDERVDIDLSAGFYNENMEPVGVISYYDLKSAFGVHSGDITSGGPVGGDGVAEFVDIDVKACEDAGIRYAFFYVNQFTGESFKDIPCDFGFMEREVSEVGKIYEPSTVCKKVELNTNAQSTVPVIFDIKERQIIWADLSAESLSGHNLSSNHSAAFAMVQSVLQSEAPSVYELISINAIANNGIIINPDSIDNLPENADVVKYTEDNLEMDTLMSTYLNPAEREIKPQLEQDKPLAEVEIEGSVSETPCYDNDER
jgi:hypothetical protein